MNLEKSWPSIEKIGGAIGVSYYPGGNDLNRVQLQYRTVYPEANNVKAAWAQKKGSAEYFEALSSDAISGDVPGLFFRNGGPDSESEFETVAAVVPEGGAHSHQFLLPKPDQPYAVWFKRWGDGGARWSFEVINGRARIVRLLPAWNDYDEGVLWLLKAIEEPSSEQQAQMAALEAKLYADEQSIELASGQEWYALGHEISFIPGEQGIFAVQVEGGKTQDVSNSAHLALIEQRGPTDDRIIPAWPLSKLTVGANGGMHGWCVGDLNFNTTGTLRFGEYDAPLGIDASDVIVTVKGQANGGTITGEAVALPNPAKHEIVITLTGDGTSSPVFTGAHAFAPGGARIGGDEVVFNTTDEPDCAIIDIRPTFEKDGRRTIVEVEMRDIGGKLSVSHNGSNVYPGDELGAHYKNFMHDRIGTTYINGIALIGRGPIDRPVVTNIRGVDTDAMPEGYGNGDTRIIVSQSDWWSIADAYQIKRPPDVARARVGYAYRALLGLPGFSASDLAGISPTRGIRLPKDFEVKVGDKLGDVLRRINELFDHGDVLQARNGWTHGARDTSIKAVFERGSSVSYVQRFADDVTLRVFNQQDISNDFTDFWNKFTVVGGPDANGVPISRSWVIWVSTGYGPDGEPILEANKHPSFIGRVKEYDTVTEESLRSEAEVTAAVKSLAASKSAPGKFLEWTSWWVDGVLPGDRVSNCGILFDLERICDASVKDDRMRFSGRMVF